MTITDPSAILPTSATPAVELALSLEKSLAFARLSGDFNPMHVDPVAARRTQYGGTVVHGMHLLLAALDAAGQRGLMCARDVDSLSVIFSNPALTGGPVRLSFLNEQAQGRLRISGESEGRVLFTANLSLREETGELDRPPESPLETAQVPIERDMPEADTPNNEWAGSVPWRLSRAPFTWEFPSLGRQPGGFAMGADLLASTRIVGMECPGLHSIYSTLKLKRTISTTAAASQGVRWRVVKIDRRFRLVRMAVTGGMFEGSIDAFFRPPPVPQASLASLLEFVAPQAYAGQRALVVGGSRGLGELTAKLLLAGGAQVTITYARGRSDAERVCAEARAHGRKCDPVHLDMRAASGVDMARDSLRSGFSHVYYFASPQIAKTSPGHWRQDLFDEFTAFYLRGFAGLLSVMMPTPQGSQPMRVLYPSTAFLDTQERGFAEYCAAKAAGEALCEHLAAHYGIRIAHPRLPRMRTDQTSGLIAAETEDALTVMRRVIDGFCS